MEAFFFAYQAFTTKPDEMLARRGLGRVHHRVLFFIARYPGLSVKELLALLGVTKQALNIPLRQLLEMNLIGSATADDDKRKRLLGLTAEGVRLEKRCVASVAAAQRCFEEAGGEAVSGWLAVNRTLARAHAGSRGEAATEAAD